MNGIIQTIIDAVGTLIYTLPTMLIAITIHELSHGLAALGLGDPTAKNKGRLTLNPIKHLDPMGAICFVLLRFGWAKPVPVNAYFFKNRRRDMALVSLAGPVSNFLLALLALTVLFAMFKYIPYGGSVMAYFYTFLQIFITMNIGFGVFNLIPIPPLDGSKILGAFLPEDKYFKFMQYDQIMMIVLLVLMFTGILSPFIWNMISTVENWFYIFVGLFFGMA